MNNCCNTSTKPPATQPCVDCAPIKVVKDPNDIYAPIDCAKGEHPIRLLKDPKTEAITFYCYVEDRNFDGSNKCGWTPVPIYSCVAPAPTHDKTGELV